jgi:predicted phage baseplate assembly protein
MPLAETFPIIDDRRYDDIITEVRTRIARYTPEWTPVWTDLNDNDPGITLVQVFAWLTEMQIYRLGKVPELNYLKFLELLGIELNPAEAASSEITFSVKPDHTAPTVIVPLGAQVTAEAPDGGAPLVFETERALVALRAQLSALQAFDGYSHQLVSAENEAATPGFLPFGTLASPDSALLLQRSEHCHCAGLLWSARKRGLPLCSVALGILGWQRLASPEPAQG